MSSTDMLKAAEEEVRRLEAELAATEAYQKLQLAKKVVALYRDNTPVNHLVARAPLIRRRLMETKAARIEKAAVNYLSEKKTRATSGELLEAMRKENIDITGTEPTKALSAYLSNSKALNNVREYGGYGLAEWGSSRGPDLLTKTGAN